MYLKRLLVGSISLSDDSQTLGENGGTAPESKEADGGQSCTYIASGFKLTRFNLTINHSTASTAVLNIWSS